MKIHITLHSILRDRLHPEAKGKAVLDVPEGSRLIDVMQQLNLPNPVVCAVNDQLERDDQRLLQDGDHLRFFRQSSGG